MGNSEQQLGQFGSNTFLEALEGVFSRVYFTKDNQGDDNIIYPQRYFPKSSDTTTRRSPNKKPSPAEILLNLRLPENPFKCFVNILKLPMYNLYLGEDYVTTANYESRWYNYVQVNNAPKQQQYHRYLIYIPKKFLKNDRLNIALITEIYTDFFASKNDSFIIVFSDVDVVDRPIREIIEQKRPVNKGMKGCFVPWIDVKNLVSEKLKEEQRKNLLASILEIPRFP